LHKNSDQIFYIFGNSLDNIISKDRKIDDRENEKEKIANVEWVRDVLFYVKKLDINEEQITHFIMPALKNIANINDKNYRNFLTQNIFSLLPNMLPPIAEMKSFTSSNRLPLLFMWSISTAEMQQFFKKLPRDIIQDGDRQRKFIETVCSLKNSGFLADEIKNVLNKIFPENFLIKKEPVNADGSKLSSRELKILKLQERIREDNLEKLKKIITCLSKIRVAASFGNEDIPTQINNINDLEEILKNIALTSFSLEEKNYKKFSSVFYSYRNEMSLLIYLSRIKNIKAASDLSAFVHLVLNDEFLPQRYARSEIFRSCDKNLQAAWKSNIAIENSNGSKYLFTDDHESFINMGIRGSCQNVEGDPSLNRALIGATMDGSEKLCILKNASGDIMQRCILRLMWAQPDASQNQLSSKGKACIFIENIYPPNLNVASKMNLINFAYSQAERLQLPVALCERDNDIAYPDLDQHYQVTKCSSSLLSGEIHVPLYSDAKRGVQEKAFSLNHSDDTALYWITPIKRDAVQ